MKIMMKIFSHPGTAESWQLYFFSHRPLERSIMLRNVKGKIRGVREDLTRGTLFEEDGFDYNGN